MTNMQDIDHMKKKILFRANHRGTKEMDMLLGKFVVKHIDSLTSKQTTLLCDFLQENDADINDWITNKKTSEIYKGIISIIQKMLFDQ